MVSGQDSLPIIYYVLALVLVASSLVGLRQPAGKTIKMVSAWVVIFGVVFIVFAFRSDFSGLWQRIRAEATGSPIADGTDFRIPVAEDGHFYVDAKVNGHSLRFLVDSGASTTTISEAGAQAAGVRSDGAQIIVQTANGSAPSILAYADRLDVGPIVRTDFPININERDDTNLLGMNFLSTLGGWRVEGTYLILHS